MEDDLYSIVQRAVKHESPNTCSAKKTGFGIAPEIRLRGADRFLCRLCTMKSRLIVGFEVSALVAVKDSLKIV